MASSKRERELARLRAERQAARRAAAAARRRQRNAIIAVVAVVALVLVGLVALGTSLHSSSKSTALKSPPSPSATPAVEASTAPNPPGSCAYTPTLAKSPRPLKLPPTVGVEHSKVYTMKIVTNVGEIDFDTLTAQAPCTSNNIRSLAYWHFFDNTACHRLVTSLPFVLQCGDPTGTGSGGPGYKFPDENLTGARYLRGTVAMANSGPGTNGSQFFLVYKDSVGLPPNYTPFGVITKGLDILDRVAAAGVVPKSGPTDGLPKVRVTILKMTFVEKHA